MIKKLLFAISFLNCSVYSAFEIPFETINSMFGAGEVRVRCFLGNNEDICKFDTGANVSTISKAGKLLQNIDTEIIASTSYTTATGAVKECDFITINNLILGEYQINQLNPVSCNLNEGDKSKNLIGLDALKNQKIYLNYREGKIIIGYEPKNENLKSFEVDSVGHILIPVNLTDGTETTAMFDTGASLTVVSNKFIDTNIARYSVLETNNLGQDSFGNAIEMRKTISTLKIEDQTYVAEYFMGIDFSAIHKNAGENVNLILGHNIISSNNWFFDLENQTWYVD